MEASTTRVGHPKLLSELEAAEIPHTVVPHRHTVNAVDEAEALGVPASSVAKTIILTTPNGFVRAVLPASEKLDLHKVRAVLGTNQVELATEQQLAGAYPDYELGAVPPIGGAKDAVLLDTRLAAGETALVEAGVHDTSVRLRMEDLVDRTRASIVDLCR